MLCVTAHALKQQQYGKGPFTSLKQDTEGPCTSPKAVHNGSVYKFLSSTQRVRAQVLKQYTKGPWMIVSLAAYFRAQCPDSLGVEMRQDIDGQPSRFSFLTYLSLRLVSTSICLHSNGISCVLEF